MKRLVALLAAALLLLTVSPATATHGGSHGTPSTVPLDEYEPTFTQQDRWFHANTGLIGNLDASEGRFVRWDDTKPTGSLHAVYHGDNFGAILEGDHGPDNFFTAQGTIAGDIDTIAFDMYLIGWAQSTIGCSMSLSFDFRIDGEQILYQDYLGSDGITYRKVSDTTVLATFALTNIWQAMKEFGLDYGPEVTHDVYVNIQNFYLCNEYEWLYDAESTPSGIKANLASPDAKGYFPIDVLSPPPPVEG